MPQTLKNSSNTKYGWFGYKISSDCWGAHYGPPRICAYSQRSSLIFFWLWWIQSIGTCIVEGIRPLHLGQARHNELKLSGRSLGLLRGLLFDRRREELKSRAGFGPDIRLSRWRLYVIIFLYGREWFASTILSWSSFQKKIARHVISHVGQYTIVYLRGEEWSILFATPLGRATLQRKTTAPMMGTAWQWCRLPTTFGHSCLGTLLHWVLNMSRWSG